MVQTANWKKLAGDSGWFELFTAGEEFNKFLDADLAFAAALLKEIGLIN
jgi:tripartite-type tricarboxylate transporter receptor subunit TctC